MHTVFSDGDVWPTVRVAEAWEEGIDAIAITDHLEYNPKKNYIAVNYNASYEIAKPAADKVGIILIHSAEITKSMPPGHLNALFVKDAVPVFNQDYKLAIGEAKKQDAFIMWNHPGWKRQAPDGAKWTDVHEQLYNSQSFKGIEVANHSEWYPEVLDWALDKNLTVLCNSDMHGLAGQYIKEKNLPYRAMTLVFAKERNEQGIREALFAGRTAGFFNNMLFGKKDLVEELFYKSVRITGPVSRTENSVLVRLTNESDIPFTLAGEGKGEPVALAPGYSVMVSVPVTTGATEATVTYQVKNVFIRSGANLPVTFRVSL